VKLGGTVVKVIAAVCAVVLVGGVIWWQFRPHNVVKLTAHFSRAIGLYPGSDVRILGVKVGTLTSVTPEGDTVRVEMEYDAKYPVPTTANAVIVPPSLVSDRYVQLTWDRRDPKVTGGPRMASGTDLPLSRTAAPLELDDLYRTVNDLSVALGPNGANGGGALNRFLEVGAANLDGEGAKLNQTLKDLSDAVRVVGENRDNLFGTITNLQQFTTTLAESDQQVRLFTQNLSNVSTQLAGERQNLAIALANLGSALGQVSTFVKGNRGVLKKNVTGLVQVTSVLVKQRAALAEFLDLAPTTLANLAHAYNAGGGALDTRSNLQFLQDPTFLCSVLVTAGIKDNTLCNVLNGVIGALPKIPGLNAPGDPNGIPTLPGVPNLPTPGGILDANGITLPTLPGVGGGG
jgi:phospholipid/cholesterol/gamma-HCH transport system substrate-binding protein